MTKQKLIYLLVVLAIIGVLYLLSAPEAGDGGKNRSVNLLGAVEGEKVVRVVLEQGDENIELRVKDGVWTIPSRADYPANEERIRSLFLKVFDLSSSQRVPAGTAGIKTLGLDEEGVKGGRSRIRFFNEAGSELGGLYLGQIRQVKDSEGMGKMPSATGQYVRRLNEDQVYLVNLPVTFMSGVSNWLDTNLENVLRSKILTVTQERLGGEGAREVVFKLTRPQSDENANFQLDTTVAPEEELQSAVLTQVVSGLENLRMSDVRQASDEEMKKLTFDAQTVYETDNGLVYRLSTVQDKDKIYAKLQVTFDEKLGKELEAKAAARAEAEKVKDEQEKAAKEAEQKQAAAEEAGSEKAADVKPEGAKPAEPEKPKTTPQLANADEAAKLSARFEPWVFQFASYQGDKFRKSRADLVKKKEKKEEAEKKELPLPPAG
jgi:hypothetical protein